MVRASICCTIRLVYRFLVDVLSGQFDDERCLADLFELLVVQEVNLVNNQRLLMSLS